MGPRGTAAGLLSSRFAFPRACYAACPGGWNRERGPRRHGVWVGTHKGVSAHASPGSSARLQPTAVHRVSVVCRPLEICGMPCA
jgi:hypothetical protein